MSELALGTVLNSNFKYVGCLVYCQQPRIEFFFRVFLSVTMLFPGLKILQSADLVKSPALRTLQML